MSEVSRTRLVSLVLLIVVFASGAVVGAAYKSILGAEEPSGEVVSAGDSDSTSDEASEPRRRTSLWERVGPSDEQRTAIDSVISHHRTSMKSLQGEFRSAYNPRYWAIVDSTRASIRSMLDSVQVHQYDSLTSSYDERERDGDNGNRFP